MDPDPMLSPYTRLSVPVPVGASNTVLSGGLVVTDSATPPAVNSDPEPK